MPNGRSEREDFSRPGRLHRFVPQWFSVDVRATETRLWRIVLDNDAEYGRLWTLVDKVL